MFNIIFPLASVVPSRAISSPSVDIPVNVNFAPSSFNVESVESIFSITTVPVIGVSLNVNVFVSPVVFILTVWSCATSYPVGAAISFTVYVP